MQTILPGIDPPTPKPPPVPVRERVRKHRAKKAEAAAAAKPKPKTITSRERERINTDPAAAVAEWSRAALRVPPGHPLAGQPMALPEYGVAFLRDALRHRESLFSVARKNSKSGIVAVHLLARLVGPLRRDGWRGGVVSITREKAGELKRQMEEIAEASGLQGLRFLRSPAPGRVESTSGTVDILAADAGAGHASGFDEAIIDELGLLVERDRPLVDGMLSAVSARNGRMMSLSIMGHAPFTRELVERRNRPGVAVHLYQAPDGCAIDDEAGWHQANPGLAAGIKSLDYMTDAARRALDTPAAQSSFRAHELNQPTKAMDAETIIGPDDWREGDAARSGPCVVAFDLGGSRSMSAFVAYWPQTGRIEAWGAFPDRPDLAERGRMDGNGREYEALAERGELRTYPGRVVPVGAFLAECAARLAGERIVIGGADRYRQAEALDALDAAAADIPGVRRWPMVWRGTGAGKVADGSADVRALQRRALTGKLISPPGKLLLQQAISESAIRYDTAGNPALDKARQRARIDALQAAVIAAGLADVVERQKPRNRKRRLHIIPA